MESSWIRCEHMRDQEKSCYQMMVKQGNYRRKTQAIRVKCGRRFRRCFPMSVRRGWLSCSSTVGSSLEKLSVFVLKNGMMYVKSIASDAILCGDYCTIRINCAGGWVREDNSFIWNVVFPTKGDASVPTLLNPTPAPTRPRTIAPDSWFNGQIHIRTLDVSNFHLYNTHM